MTPEQADQILSAFFNVVNHVNTLHLTGGGEPFLHKDLDALIEVAMKYQSQFDRLMLFSNSTVPVSDKLLSVIKKYSDKIVVQLSRYNVKPDREQNTVDLLSSQGIRCKIEKYYGEDQSFGGWIDFGTWEKHNRTPEHLSNIFKECVLSIQYANNLVVIKTVAGGANSACAFIDHLNLTQIIGTLAGDDTIFVVTQDEECARRFSEELRRMMG